MISGVIFYSGPSRIDGKPIVGIATLRTRNEKTGNLVQTWILRSDISPWNAIHSGEDSSICGGCPLRGIIEQNGEKTTNRNRGCYVLIHTAPLQIYKAYHNNTYPILAADHKPHFAGRSLRYGSYGDPVAIPRSAWRRLEGYCTGRNAPGYTHQWTNPRFQCWRTRLMASTHTLADNQLAAAMGWRTFRTMSSLEQLSDNEIICPASPEGGDKATCESCGACNGRTNMSDSRRNIAIIAHGTMYKVAALHSINSSI